MTNFMKCFNYTHQIAKGTLDVGSLLKSKEYKELVGSDKKLIDNMIRDMIGVPVAQWNENCVVTTGDGKDAGVLVSASVRRTEDVEEEKKLTNMKWHG